MVVLYFFYKLKNRFADAHLTTGSGGWLQKLRKIIRNFGFQFF